MNCSCNRYIKGEPAAQHEDKGTHYKTSRTEQTPGDVWSSAEKCSEFLRFAFCKKSVPVPRRRHAVSLITSRRTGVCLCAALARYTRAALRLGSAGAGTSEVAATSIEIRLHRRS